VGPASLVVSLVLSVSAGDFDSLLSVREFGPALELAENDSMRAVVHMCAGEDSSAAVLFRRAFLESPSAALLALMWEAAASADGVEAAATDDDSAAAARWLREDIRRWEDAIEWGPEDLLSLAGSAILLNDTATSDILTEKLLSLFPGSEEAYKVLGWEFYDGLYPVWYDDSARVPVIRDFILERGGLSNTWRSAAYRSLLSATLGTADSSSWREVLEEWTVSCPEDPQACLSGAALMIERDSAFSDALEEAERGLALMEGGWRPEGMPEEEWALTGPSLKTGLHLRSLQALAGAGYVEEALASLDPVIDGFQADADDHGTASSLHWLRGELLIALGDTAAALSSYSASAALGDVVDRWSGMSLEAMEGILLPDRSPLDWARDAAGYSGPVFADLTPLLGPDSLLRGSRVSWCDWDADGWQDLYAGRRLYRNLEGSGFVDVTSRAGLDSCRGNGGIWGDLDRNGWPDLVTAGNPPQLFLNSQGVMAEHPLPGPDSAGSSIEGVGILDWDGDGWLDLYLAGYELPGQPGTGTEDFFYFGGPDGLRRTGDSLGMIPFLGIDLCGRGVSPCDFDRDGDIDIFVSNYRLQENILWENRDGTAENTALRRGIAGNETDGWWGHTIGSAWADWDNDGDWDLFSANLAHPRYITFSDRSMLYRNDGGVFTDVRAEAGIKFEETHSNPVWGDFDNDGLLDLFITSVYPDRRSFLYLNRGDGTFEDVTWLSGARVMNGWGAAAADYNMDGRLDLAVGTADGPVLLSNVSPPGNWALVRLSPPDWCNPSAIGCTVFIEQGDHLLMRQVEGGGGTTAQNGQVLHFGLPGPGPFLVGASFRGSKDASGLTAGSPGSLIVLGPLPPDSNALSSP